MLGIAVYATMVHSLAEDRALLIGMSQAGDLSPENDCALVREALKRRGWKDSQITTLAGEMTEGSIEAAVRHFVQSSKDVGVLYLSGSGKIDRRNLQARPFGQGPDWGTILGQLGQASARFEVWPDTGFTNVLVGVVPANVSLLAQQGSWSDASQSRKTGPMFLNGREIECGVMSTILARELPYATTMADLEHRVTGYKNSGSMGAIWFNGPLCDVLGPSGWFIPGIPLDH